MPDPKSIAREALVLLRERADPERARGVQVYFKEPVRAFGLAAPDMRGLAAELYVRVRAEWTVDDAVALCDLLFRRPELEARGVAMLILQRYRKSYPESLMGRVHAWLSDKRLDNWATVDGLCPDVLGTLLLRNPRLAVRLVPWARHHNRWVRRASIVAFLLPVRRGQCVAEAYAMAERHFASEDDLIHKAAGWLLREAGKPDMAALEAFLLRHGPRIPRTTLRYAIERFAPARRRQLLARTRSTQA
jgi:3-methyladenine DNA glycosylase AlkD